MKSSQSDMVVK